MRFMFEEFLGQLAQSVFALTCDETHILLLYLLYISNVCVD